MFAFAVKKIDRESISVSKVRMVTLAGPNFVSPFRRPTMLTGGNARKIRLHGVLEVYIVIKLIDGCLVRESVEELECSETSLYFVRRLDPGRDVRGHFHLGCPRESRQRDSGQHENERD